MSSGLNLFQPDPCCSGPLSAALEDGSLDGKSDWTCPKCGSEWKAEIVIHGDKTDFPYYAVRHWSVVPVVEVFQI